MGYFVIFMQIDSVYLLSKETSWDSHILKVTIVYIQRWSLDNRVSVDLGIGKRVRFLGNQSYLQGVS